MVAALGYAGASGSLAVTLQYDNPKQAARLIPEDGRVLGAFSRTLVGANATESDRARASRLARKALRLDPTVVAALTTLGLNTQLQGNVSEARRLFAYSERLSRRDLPAQLWQVEDAVSRGDINAALRHYDTALRTSSAAPDIMFPILGSAISDPAIRAALVRTLARKPDWASNFITYVSANGTDPLAAANLFLNLRRVGVPIPAESNTALINLLISRGAINDAWNYYANIHPGVDRSRSRDPDFNAGITGLSPFDWRTVDVRGISASIQRGDRGGLLYFSAAPGVGGVVLQQFQLLAPGTYRLTGHGVGIDQAMATRPYWALTCFAGRELGRVDVVNSTYQNGNFAGNVSVPADCPVQTLSLMVRPSDAVSGVTGQIDRVQLVQLH